MRHASAIAVSLAVSLTASCARVCPSISRDEKVAFLSVKPEEGGYVIQPGDALQVEVWKNDQLTRTVSVRPDGRITLPLVNDVPAAGNTVPQFQKRLTERLRSYLKDPIISITLTQFSTKQLYVQGQVNTPAAYVYSGEMSVLQAMALAGGVSPLASGCAVVVRRKGAEFVRYDVSLDPLLTGANLAENITLHPNDVVTVH